MSSDTTRRQNASGRAVLAGTRRQAPPILKFRIFTSMTLFMFEDTILPSFRTLCRGCLRSPISGLTLSMLHFSSSVDQKNDVKLKSLGEKSLHKKPKCLGICEQNENLLACDVGVGCCARNVSFKSVMAPTRRSRSRHPALRANEFAKN